MQTIDAEAVHRLLDYPGLIKALRMAHAGGTMPQTSVGVMSDHAPSKDKFVSLVAWASGDIITTKLVGVFPGNAALSPPQPSVQGLVVAFSGRTGAPLLAADGAALTFRKTAADSALGADILARKDARTLLVVGAGGLAPHVIEAYLAVRPLIDRVLIWNRHRERALELAKRLSHLQASISVAESLLGAVPEADIVTCVTMATAPLVVGKRLKVGAHVDLIGAYLPDMREADDDVVRRAGRVFVDTFANCTGSGDISQPLAAGLITRSDIVADLFDLCSGRHSGRTSDSEITMFKNVGGGHLDLFTTRYLLSAI